MTDRPHPSERGHWRASSGRCEVSVAIPTRNRPWFLRQAVDSALHQVDVDLEVIVVDDSSDLPEARTALRFEDPRIRVLVGPRPGGPGSARNEALAHAPGEWVAFVDDDLFAPMRLRAHPEAARGAGFGCCGQILVDHGRRAVGTPPAPSAERLPERLRTSSFDWWSQRGHRRASARSSTHSAIGACGCGWRLERDPSRYPTSWSPYTAHPSNMHLRAPERVLADFSRFERVHDLGPTAEMELLEWLAEDLEGAGRGHPPLTCTSASLVTIAVSGASFERCGRSGMEPRRHRTRLAS